MERNALIITTRDNAYTRVSSGAWKQFLPMPVGGNWTSVHTLMADAATKANVAEAVAKSAATDYSLIIFIGTGQERRTERPWAEVVLDLTCDESITERELNPGSRWCGIIIDTAGDQSIRYNDNNRFDESMMRIPDAGETDDRAAAPYVEAVRAAESGVCRIIATARGEETPVDLPFGVELIRAAENWAKKHRGVLYFNEAAALMDAESPTADKYRVEYRGGRRTKHFPLALGYGSR